MGLIHMLGPKMQNRHFEGGSKMMTTQENLCLLGNWLYTWLVVCDKITRGYEEVLR